EDARLLRAVAAEGIAREELAARPIAAGVLGQVTASGEPHYGARGRQPAAVDPRKDEPAIAVPLKIRDRAVGVIAIWGLLARKPGRRGAAYESSQPPGPPAAGAPGAARLAAEAAQAGPTARLSFGRLAETL